MVAPLPPEVPEARADPRLERLAVPAALLGSLLACTNMIVIKAAFAAGFQPLILGGLRCLAVTLMVLAFFLATRRRLLPEGREARRWLGWEALGKCVGALPIYLSVWILPATVVILLGFTRPLFELLFVAHLCGDRVGVRRAGGLGIGLVGLLTWAVYQDAPGGVTGVPLVTGISLALLGVALTAALSSLQKRAFRAGASAMQSVLVSSALQAVVWTAAALAGAQAWRPLPVGAWPWLIFAYLCTVAGLGMFSYRRWLVSRYHVSFLSTFNPVGRCLALLLAPLLLGEALPLRGLVALALIGLGAGLSWPRTAGPRAEATVLAGS